MCGNPTVLRATPSRDGGRAEHGTDVILTLRVRTRSSMPTARPRPTIASDRWGLKSLIQQYSNYVRYPIQMMVVQEPPEAQASGGCWR